MIINRAILAMDEEAKQRVCYSCEQQLKLFSLSGASDHAWCLTAKTLDVLTVRLRRSVADSIHKATICVAMTATDRSKP